MHRSSKEQESFTYYNRIYSDSTATINYRDNIELCQNPGFYLISEKLHGDTIASVMRKGAFGIESNFVESNPDKVALDSTPFDNPVHIFANDKSGSTGRSKWFYTDLKNITKGRLSARRPTRNKSFLRVGRRAGMSIAVSES